MMKTLGMPVNGPKSAVKAPRVLHLLEASLGGTRQYLDDFIAAEVNADQGLIYADLRADSAWPLVLKRAANAGWKSWNVRMHRQIAPADDFKAALRIAKIIGEFKPEILHCHSSKAGALGRLASALSLQRPRVVYSPHALAHNISKVYLWIERCLAPLTNWFCAVSPSEQADIQAAGLCTVNRIGVISPAIRADTFATLSRCEARERLNIAQDAELLIGVGRLVDQKQPLEFLQIFSELSAKRPKLSAIWVGDGVLRPQLEHEISRLNLQSRITITGWSNEVPLFISAADILLSTASYESFGYVIAESLSMGTAVVAARVSGVSDVLAECLFECTYPVGDRSEAQRQIVNFLDDQNFCKTITSKGRDAILKRYSLDAMRNNADSFYASVLSKGPVIAPS